LAELAEMGFTDIPKCETALDAADGDVGAAVAMLCG
jgi:hypothetical protein